MRPSKPRGAPVDSPRVARVKQFVEAHLAQPLTLVDAAKVAGLSASYFSAWFHRETGERFGQWLRGVRVRRAMELLRDGPVRETARDVGYCQLRTFERAFKRETSLSPREFERTLARRGARLV